MHVATKTALTFPKLMTIAIGRTAGQCKYWAIQNAVAFARDAGSGRVLMLAPSGDWYRDHAAPEHDQRYFDPAVDGAFTFGAGRTALAVMPDPDGDGYHVVGDPSAFNPHFWEPTVIPPPYE